MTGTNDKLRSLFLALLMVGSVFGATIAFSGTAAAANNAVSVSDATEANGDITVEFNESVENAANGDLTEANFEVYIQSATSQNYVRWNSSGDADGEITAGDITKRSDSEYVLEGDNTWGDLFPADDVKVNVVDVRRIGGVSGTINTGNVSVGISSAVLNEDDNNFNTESTARRLYQGTPITLNATSDNTPFLFQNVENNQTLAEYSTGMGSSNFVFDTDQLNVGETYRVVFNPTNSPNQNVQNKGPRSEKYITLDSLDLSGSLAEDGATFSYDESQDISVSGSAKRANQPAVVEVGGSVFSADWDNAGNLINSDYSDLGFGEGDYTVTLTDIQTGNSVEAGSFSVEPFPEASDASFGENVVEDTRGDVARIPIEIETDDTGAMATVSIGSKGETNYVTNVTVADENGDGEVTLLFNTYNAGTQIQERVFSAAGDDVVMSWRGEHGEFVETLEDDYANNLTRAREATLDATNYQMQIAAHDADQRNIFNFSEDTADSISGSQVDEVSTLSLSSRTTESSDDGGSPGFGAVTALAGLGLGAARFLRSDDGE